MKRPSLLRTTLSAPILLVAACGSNGTPKFDVANYLSQQCEAPNSLSVAMAVSELASGKSIKINAFSITSEGSGKITMQGPDKHATIGSVRQDPISAEGGSVYITQNGVGYQLSVTEGSQKSTHLEISRSCERK